MTAYRVRAMVACLMMAGFTGTVHGQILPSPAQGREYQAVNGTSFRCPLPSPPSPEQQARQFDRNPQNLELLSARAKEMFNSNGEMARQFKERQA